MVAPDAAPSPDDVIQLVVAFAARTAIDESGVDRATIIKSRRAVVEAEAAPVLAVVDLLGGSAGTPSWLTHTVTVRVPMSVVEDFQARLRALDDVVSVTPDPSIEFEVPVVLEEDVEPVGGPG